MPAKARKRMSLNEALRVLMQSASRDVRGAGLGVRSTSDEWRTQVSEAWAVAWRRVHGWEPSDSDYSNAGMKRPPRSVAPADSPNDDKAFK